MTVHGRENAPDINWFVITEAGRRWAMQSDPSPEDPEGYLITLKKLVPNIDTVISQYIEEALIPYDRQAFFAAAVMVGQPVKR